MIYLSCRFRALCGGDTTNVPKRSGKTPVVAQVLYWCLCASCAFNFAVMFYRCAVGVDFEYDDGRRKDVDLQASAAGASDRPVVIAGRQFVP